MLLLRGVLWTAEEDGGREGEVFVKVWRLLGEGWGEEAGVELCGVFGVVVGE